MSTQTHWRLAFMFDALDGDATALARRLENEAASIGIAAQGNAVRKGVAHRNVAEHSAVNGSHDTVGWPDVEGAIEVSIPNGSVSSVPTICQAMRPILDRLAAPGSIEVMTGAIVRRQNIRHRSRRKLVECGPRLGVDVRRRACGAASVDIRWSVA